MIKIAKSVAHFMCHCFVNITIVIHICIKTKMTVNMNDFLFFIATNPFFENTGFNRVFGVVFLPPFNFIVSYDEVTVNIFLIM